MKRTCALCNPVLIDDTLTTYYTVYYIVTKAVNCVLSETTLRDLETNHISRILGPKWKYVESRHISHGTAHLITLGTMRVYTVAMDTAFALRKHM